MDWSEFEQRGRERRRKRKKPYNPFIDMLFAIPIAVIFVLITWGFLA